MFQLGCLNCTCTDFIRDQELRFTVHDSPDYYQLKVSVFNDDKKTDLIGESWISLQDVIIPGGGQNDLWHNLNCRGKYAGEIRIEITYYDTRPKQERPEKAKQAPANGIEEGSRDSLKGPRQPKSQTPVKRRPLPSDPVTGAPAPAAIPDHVQTPPRGYQSPAGKPDYVQRGYQGTPEYAQTAPRGPPPTAIPDHVQTPPRGYQTPSYIPNQSPLQNVEYGTPPTHFPSYSNSPSMNGYGAAAPQAVAKHEHHEIYDPMAAMNNHAAVNSNGRGHYDDEEEIDPRDSYNSQHSPYDLPHPEDFGPPPSPGGPPPPPPAHRSRHGSNQPSPAPVMKSQGSYGYPTDRRPSNPYDIPLNELHRHSMPTYPQEGSYPPYGSPGNDDQFRRSANGSSQQTPPRHHSYDSRSYDYGSMQPTVEDAPPSPSGHYSGHRGSGSRTSKYEERRYEQVPSPAPLNLSGRGSATSSRGHASSAPSHQYSTSSGYAPSNSDLSYRDQSHASSVSSRTGYSPMPQQNQPLRKQSYDPQASPSEDYGLPPVPATLVAGMDPMIAQEISDRIYDEKRASYSQQSGTTRGRQDSAPYQQNRPHPLSYHEAATPFVPAAATYDDRQSRFSTATAPVAKPRALSPDPRVPARKSVSPSPAAAASADDGRRLSGIPFGPDSYNALNPKISTSISTPSLSSRYDTEKPEDAKIITHDGREIDPSDHIPESNYAPLLEAKGPKYASQLPDRNYRPSPTQPPVSSSGRRPLKVAPRPHSMSTGSPAPVYTSDPMTPTGRNRLQKKANRMSAQSSPLAPITPYQNNVHTPRSQSRPGTGTGTGEFDANENYSQGYNGYRGSAGPPPIPAKVPMGSQQQQQQQGGGGDAWALLEEMKNIDLGGGRSRRRGY